MHGSRPIKRPDWRYLSFWLTIIAFLATIISVVRTNSNTNHRIGITEVEPHRLKTDKQRVAEERYNEKIPPDFKISGGKFTLSNDAGDVKLIIYCDKLITIQGNTTLSELGAVFETPKGQSVALIAKDLQYSFREEVLNITGKITGMFPLSGQRFTTNSVYWDQSSSIVKMKDVQLDQMGFKVASKNLEYNLDNQEIDMNAGISAEF